MVGPALPAQSGQCPFFERHFVMDPEGFDLWAAHYEESVFESDRKDEYPFAGYRALLSEVVDLVHKHGGRQLLDLGLGTGLLAKFLYDRGFQITGVDFSEKMLAQAEERMPQALLIQHDLTKGLPDSLAGRSFDLILSTYALHHLKDQVKVKLIHDLTSLLSPEGVIIIGDIAFPSWRDLEACRKITSEWDDDEYYWVMESIRPLLPDYQVSFQVISHCAGILQIRPAMDKL